MNGPLVEWGLKLVLVAFHSEKLFIGFNPDLNSGSGAANLATSLSFKSIFSRLKAVKFFLYSTISVTRITFLKVHKEKKKQCIFLFQQHKLLSEQGPQPLLPEDPANSSSNDWLRPYGADVSPPKKRAFHIVKAVG